MPWASAGLLSVLIAGSSATPLLTLRDAAIDESSGLARSGRHAGLLWTHNDGGAVADIFAIDRRGRTVGRIRLRGIDPYDPEALAPGRDERGRPALFLGDIGDNRERRPDVSVFRVTEPRRLGTHTREATWFRFRYPDGPHDAEALLVDPRDGRIWVATKSFGVGGLYRAPRRPVVRSRGTNLLTRVADVPPLVTDGAFLPSGQFVLRTYTSGYLYDAPGRLDQQIVLPIQEQGESLAVDGNRLLVGSEGVHSEVYAVPLPRAARSRPAATAASPASGSGPDGRSSWRRALTWAGALGVLLLGAAGAATRRRRRRPRGRDG
jgi:hypothetical protein